MDLPNLQDYRRLLADLDSEFHKTDVKSIKFLCEPSLRPKKLFANIHSGLEIFNALEKSQLLGPGDLSYLAEVLHTIGRVDLATQVDPNCDFDEDSVLFKRQSRVDRFRTLLFRLSEDLGSHDVTQLRFLYQNVPKKMNIDEGIDLFTIMLQHKKIAENDMRLLKKLLHDIQRKDLVGEIEDYETRNPDIVNPDFQDFGNHVEASPVPESLYSGEENFESSEPQKGYEKSCDPTKLGENEMSSLKQNIVEGEPMDESPSPSDNTKQPSFSSGDSVPPLETFPSCSQFSRSSRGLEACTYPPEPLEYLSVQVRASPPCVRAENDNIPVSQTPASVIDDEDVPRFQQPASASDPTVKIVEMPNCQIPPEQLLNNTTLPAACCAADDDYTPLERYKMDAVPRGICLVIDNHKFSYDPADREAIRLTDREGSTVDRDSLTKSFERLGFSVEILENKADQELMGQLIWYSQQNHGLFDCFVCCILSHGGENHIYGTNGRRIQLRDITALFRAQSCPTLAGKPKLFFMATCRGKEHQYGVDADIQPDAAEREPLSAWIPNEADFLLGYSTVMNYVSYRSRSKGTFYVNELTKVLDKYADREDIHTLLTRVNDEVSKRVYQDSNNQICKQIPAPQHTLRKTLHFLPLL